MQDFKILQEAFGKLFNIAKELQEHFHSKKENDDKKTSSKFSLDGQIIGAFAEQVAALAYNLDLQNNPGYDAITKDGTNRKVEIKFRSGNKVSIEDMQKCDKQGKPLYAEDTIFIHLGKSGNGKELEYKEFFCGTVEDYTAGKSNPKELEIKEEFKDIIIR